MNTKIINNMKTNMNVSLWPINNIKECIELCGKQQAAEIFVEKLKCLMVVSDIEKIFV